MKGKSYSNRKEKVKRKRIRKKGIKEGKVTY